MAKLTLCGVLQLFAENTAVLQSIPVDDLSTQMWPYIAGLKILSGNAYTETHKIRVYNIYLCQQKPQRRQGVHWYSRRNFSCTDFTFVFVQASQVLQGAGGLVFAEVLDGLGVRRAQADGQHGAPAALRHAVGPRLLVPAVWVPHRASALNMRNTITC